MAVPVIFFALPASEKKLIFRAFFLALRVRFLVWTCRPAVFLKKKIELVRTAENIPASRVLWAVIAVTKRIPMGSNCLVRAITAQELLSRYGYPSELRIGVAKPDTGCRIQAHAWLENNGKILIGEEETRSWTPLPSF